MSPEPAALLPPSADRVALAQSAAAAADRAAAAVLFATYRAELAPNTRAAQDDDLARLVLFFTDVGVPVGALGTDPHAWAGCSWGLLEAFKRWLLAEGYAIATINRTLATTKSYIKLATKAGALTADAAVLIATVHGYGGRAARNLDADRPTTRRSTKKPTALPIALAQARTLKAQPTDTPQGRRDALILALLLDHGLRVGELAALTPATIDIERETLTFYREKVGLTQTHRLSAATLHAARSYLHDLSPLPKQLLRGSRKNGQLAGTMGVRAIQARLRLLGKQIGLTVLSPHDCRHYWATAVVAGGTDLLALQEAGGWSSLEMPRRYVERAAIANDRVKLDI